MSIEQKIASRIQQYLPDLRKQIRLQIRTQLHKTNKQILSQKTDQLRQHYTKQLQHQAQSIKQNINTNVQQLSQLMKKSQQQILQVRNRKLTEEEKSRIVQDTVEGIVGDERMVGEIRVKLYPGVEDRIFRQLQAKLHEELVQYQESVQDKANIQRQQWQRQRQQYWRNQSQRQIQVLAQQHKDLQLKKVLIQQSLAAKKAQRDALLRQQNQLVQNNNEIAYLKNQIKLLS